MKETPFVLVQRGVVLAGCLVAFMLSSPAAVWAALAGSGHDFTSTGPAPNALPVTGSCSACHRAHKAASLDIIWVRLLSQEQTFYAQDGTPAPNYVTGGTLECYDCHDNGAADADPPLAVWGLNHAPQDIALAGSAVGYYENACGQLPGGANPAPTDGSPTGGHYWQSEPSGTPDFGIGDKIPCSLCHDPHNTDTGTNEAFFRQWTWNGSALVDLNSLNSYGTNLTASANTRDGSGNGRAMCATCHGYVDDGNPQVLYGVTLPRPPAGVAEHTRNGSTVACTDCHGHNQIAGCNGCHGYPPLVATAFDRVTNPNGQSYAGGAGAHQRHLDALGASIFNCAICHGPNPGRPTTAWHNQNATNCGVPVPDNVDIMGQSAYWDPTGTRTNAGYSGVASSVPVPAGYEFSAKGGGDQRCSNLACHGDPPDVAGALNWGDDMVDEATGNPVGDGLLICKWCHDANPARIGAGPNAPNVLGDNTGATGVWTTGTWGADVSGHGKASGNYDADTVGEVTPGGAPAANKQCTECHDATYVGATPVKAHFDGLNAENRLRGTINGIAAADEDATCVNCHQNTTGGDSASAMSQVSTHGNSGFSGAYHAAYTRQCRQCHEVHGANWNGTGRNLHMIGKWLDENANGAGDASEGARVDSNAINDVTDITTADLKVNLTANSGQNSYDDGFDDGQHDSVCAVCHRSANMNPLHQPQSSPYNNSVESTALLNTGHNPIGTDCIVCHKHDSDKAAPTADAWMPSGCFGCHGTNDSEPLQNDPNAGGVSSLRGQFWPDGSAVLAQYAYADNQTGAHRRHVEAFALRLYGETAAQVVTDTAAGNATDKQKTICAFCHPNPGVGTSAEAHSVDGPAGPSGTGRVDVFGGTGADLDSGTPVVLDWLRKYTPNAGPLAAHADDTTTAPPNGYNFTSQTCASLACHNQAATPATWNAPPAWAAGNAACSNLTCHGTATYTIAHGTHVGASPKSYACTECHADNYTVSPTNPIPLAHGSGEVDMKFDNVGSLEVSHGGDGFYDKDSTAGTAPSAGDTAFAYKSGGALATDPAYARSCYRVYCHGGDNDNNLPTSLPDWGGTTTSPSPVWNTIAVPLACTTCHAAAPTTARHIKHDNNNAWVPNECGSCHVANNDKTTSMGAFATHGNGSADMAVAMNWNPATGTCTNTCHLVGVATLPVSADPGDWLDTNPLACTDCHSATYIGTAPASGLHAATTAMAHDSQFLAAAADAPTENATCTHCHLATGPSSTHIDTVAVSAPQNSTQTTYSFNGSYLFAYDNAGYPAATSCQATCHSDYKLADTGGLWKRAWVGVTDARPLATNNPGDPVCGNCHGDFTTGWNFDEANASTTDHTDPYSGNTGDKMSQHSVCETCHGWGHANYEETWGALPPPPAHGDGYITMNGPDAVPGPAAGAEYDDATGGCAKACHGPALVLNTNSGWPINYGNFGSGACEGCHNGVQTQYPLAPNVMGNGTLPAGDPVHTTPQPFDDGAYGYNVNGHGRDGDTSAESNGDPIGVACTGCHDDSFPSGAHLDGVLNGRISPDTRNTNSFHLLSGFVVAAAPVNEWDVQIKFDDTCYNTCHTTGTTDMRHALDTKGIHATPNVVELGQYNSYSVPNNTPPPEMFYDRNLMVSSWARDGAPNFALCVSCHNPHGTDIASSRNDGNNKMVLYKWSQPAKLCAKCHP